MLPPVLIVHLKRFKYNDYGKMGSKNDAAIHYPTIGWDLKSHVKSKRGAYPRYDLYAVSNHMGGLGSGHYTAHALNRFDDTWYEFNDSSYRSVSESIHKRLSKSAYVLFYNRSEGDQSMPLNERSPLIRRQSVSRPELWPHSQVDDPRMIRSFTRASRRHLDSLEQPDFSSLRIKKSEESSGKGVKVMSSINESAEKLPSIELQKNIPQESSGHLPGPPSAHGSEPSARKYNTRSKAKEEMKRNEKPRRRLRSTRPREI